MKTEKLARNIFGNVLQIENFFVCVQSRKIRSWSHKSAAEDLKSITYHQQNTKKYSEKNYIKLSVHQNLRPYVSKGPDQQIDFILSSIQGQQVCHGYSTFLGDIKLSTIGLGAWGLSNCRTSVQCRTKSI